MCLGAPLWAPLINSVVGWNSGVNLLLRSCMWCSAKALPAPLPAGCKGGNVITPQSSSWEGIWGAGKKWSKVWMFTIWRSDSRLAEGPGFLPWSFFFLHGLGMAESNWNNVRSVGNLEINCWAWKKQAKGCQKVGKACLDCLQRDLRLRGPKPSQYITGMNLQHGSVPRLEMASGLCYNPSAINGMFSLMQDHDLSFSRRNHCPSPRGLCCIVDAVKGSNVSKQGFSMGQYRQTP